MSRRILAIATLLASPVVVAGQDTSSVRTWPPWRTSYFPYVEASPNDGLMGVARIVMFRQAAYDDRVSVRSAISVDAGYSTRGSRMIRARADFPRIAHGWRLAGSVDASSEAHLGDPDGDLHRARVAGWVDVTRTIRGPLHAAIRLSGDDSRFEEDPALLTRYPRSLDGCILSGTPCADVGIKHPLAQTDFQARGALVLDLRDREFDTRRGILVEAGAFVGGAGDGYTGGYMLAKGWHSPRVGTVLTARAAARAVSQTTAAAILGEIPSWERPVGTLGGMESHRALGVEELVGRGVLMAGVEARHDVMNFGNIGAVTLLAFVDGGRIFRDLSPLVDPVPGAPVETGDFRLTLSGWTLGAGGGATVRLLRNAQLTMTIGRANEKTRVHVGAGTSW